MRTHIKFCGLTRAGDVRDAVALGVDAVGFVFYPGSARVLEPDQARDLRALLPSFVRAVGLFVDAPIEQVLRIRDAVGLDVLQLHGEESAQYCDALGQRSATGPARTTPWWRAARMREGFDLMQFAARYPGCDALVLDAFTPAYGGAGTRFDWALVPPGGVGHRLVMSGGLSSANVGEAIARLAPFAVDVSSAIQVEGRPREKDRAKMSAFVAAVLAADALRRIDHETL